MLIRPRKNPSGKIVYQFDKGTGPGGRKSYKTKAKAQQAMDLETRRREQHGQMIDGISSVEMAELVSCRDRLKQADATISEATEFFMAHGRRLQEPLKIPELAKRFRVDRQNKKLSDQYVTQLGTSLGWLSLMYPETYAHELTAKHVQTWIGSGKWGPVTRNNYLGDVSAMFEWALLPTQGYARINPCAGVEREPDKRRGKVATVNVEQAEQMLRAAAEQQNWRVLAFLVVGLFGGLRPEAEAADQKFAWQDINLDERTIRLTEEVVKTGPGRVVDLTEEAVEWLRLIPADQRKEGPVVPKKNWKHVWMLFRYSLGWDVVSEKVRKKQCFKDVESVHGRWPKDVLRHTFASNHYAHYQNEALLQVQMGHRSSKMIHEHYRAVKTRQEAALYWKLRPALAA